ncbi:MAG: thiamine pyrophosphate-dependent enzyme, partial [Proteobacteria bacterium]|nr:thiamine pyrophosphate-dependent enzyme [Pseudomonadota bacterium]
FASLHKVPVLFLCEDNGLAVHTGAKTRQSFNVEALVGAFGIPFMHLDEGYDPELVSNAAFLAINHVRTNQSPFFLRVRTCRYREHVGPGEDFFGGYRSEADLAEWKSRDPLITRADELSGYEVEIRAEIDAAVAYAMNSPFPTEEDLLADVL